MKYNTEISMNVVKEVNAGPIQLPSLGKHGTGSFDYQYFDPSH